MSTGQIHSAYSRPWDSSSPRVIVPDRMTRFHSQAGRDPQPLAVERRAHQRAAPGRAQPPISPEPANPKIIVLVCIGRTRLNTMKGMFPSRSGAARWVASIMPSIVPMKNQTAELMNHSFDGGVRFGSEKFQRWFLLRKAHPIPIAQ